MTLQSKTEQLAAALAEARDLVIGVRAYLYGHDYECVDLVTTPFTVFDMMRYKGELRQAIIAAQIGDVVSLDDKGDDVLIVTHTI
jgi:hypothetical protein